MRTVLATTLASYAARPDFVFLTGDLGFRALEPIQQAAGSRFINAGVAEQNMISVAAGLARSGMKPWAYSIAPFAYARPFEQIRNDVCHHDLPVFVIGNGGGYAYGVMGATHHAIEDYGVMLTLPNMMAFVPAFSEDLPAVVARVLARSAPAYLRLGRDEKPKQLELPPYAPFRRVLAGDGPLLVVVGPLVGTLLEVLAARAPSERPSVWVVSELPIDAKSLPKAFVEALRAGCDLTVVEEHVAQGGAGQMLARALLVLGLTPRRFNHKHAVGYPSGRYGSQSYHRRESGLDPDSILADLER